MKIFLLLDPPTATAQERQVTIVHNKPVFYQPEKLKEAKRILRLNYMFHGYSLEASVTSIKSGGLQSLIPIISKRCLKTS